MECYDLVVPALRCSMYKSVHKAVKRTAETTNVIVKYFVQDAVDTAKGEVKSLLQVQGLHGVQRFIALVEDKVTGGVNVISKYEDGYNLAHMIDSKTITRADRIAIMHQLAEVVCEMKKKNICHGDIKPENVIVRKKQQQLDICLIDFDMSGPFDTYSFDEYDEEDIGGYCFLPRDIFLQPTGSELSEYVTVYQLDLIDTLMKHKQQVPTFDQRCHLSRLAGGRKVENWTMDTY